jgi:hypothetical protein
MYKTLIGSYLAGLEELFAKIRSLIDEKRDQFNYSIQQIIQVYKSKLETKNKLMIKARVNLILEIIGKLHKASLQENIHALDEMYRDLKDDIKRKSNTNEMELYLQEKLNSLVIERLTEESEQFSCIDDVFVFLFGKVDQKGTDCLFKRFIELFTRKKKSVLSEQQRLETELELKNSIKEFHEKILYLVGDLYFPNNAQQRMIKDLNDELMIHLNRYVYSSKETTKEFLQLKISLNNMIQSKCYKINNYSTFIDSNKSNFDLYEVDSQAGDILKDIECIFDDMSLAVNQKMVLPHRISSLYSHIRKALLLIQDNLMEVRND